jgi:hypothetical protein
MTTVRVDELRDSILSPLVEENLSNILDGDIDLFEYIASDSTGQTIAVGRFLFPLKAQVEYLDPNRPHVIRSGKSQPIPNQIVAVRIPYNKNIATIGFFKLDPSPSVPIEKWKKIRYGQISLGQGPIFTHPPKGGN